MTEVLAVRMADLPSISTAALPANYEAATEALARCHRIDECKDWADKMAAIASYARQADDRTLHNFAVRISARAIRRCGELLQTFQSPGARTDQPADGDDGRLRTQRQAADAAGMSERQELTAVRVANVPDDVFEAAVECEHPATVTQLAEIGKTARPPTMAPSGFVEATHAIGVIKEFADFCSLHRAPFVAGGVRPYDLPKLRASLSVVCEWLAIFQADIGG